MHRDARDVQVYSLSVRHCVAGSEYHPPVVDLDAIKACFLRDEFELTHHAVDQTLLRGIKVQELREAVEGAEIIEDYPDDKYGPSCLLFGRTRAGRPLHAQVSYPSHPLIKVVHRLPTRSTAVAR